MNRLLASVLVLSAASAALCMAQPPPRLALDQTKTFIVNKSTNKPFYVVGEDAFDLAVQVSNADLDTYLADRAARGFNLIWVAAADNTYQTNAPQDFAGDSPFSVSDFTNFNANYWAHIDLVINHAANYGIVIGLNPAFVGILGSEGYLNSISAASAATMTAYGAFLGARYKSFPNVLYILGGDFDGTNSTLAANIAALGQGIHSADPDHLITVEPCRSCGSPTNSSIDVYTTVPSWLGVNWVYPATVGGTYDGVAAACASFYASDTQLPPLDGEDWYELEHSTTALMLRQESYYSLLTGCRTGRLFGNGAIWTMGGASNTTGQTWQSQLASTGSVQWALAGKLANSRQWWTLIPDASHTYLTAGYGSGSTLSVLARTADGQSMIAYVPNGNATTITVNMAGIVDGGSQAKCWWFSPASGATTLIGTFSNSGSKTFTPPDANDWVLVIDANSFGLCAPGSCGFVGVLPKDA